MNLRNTLVASVMVCGLMTLAVLPRSVFAQPIYFHDDFEGSALKPNWIQPPAEHWEHDVSGGFLNVTKLNYPSAPHTGFNIAELWAPLDLPVAGDFVAELVLEFEPATFANNADRVLSFFLSDQAPNVPPASTIGISYQDTGLEDVVLFMGSGGQSVPSPVFSNPGLATFQISRIDTVVNFSMDGNLLATLPAAPNYTIQSLGIWFITQWPDAQFEPIRIDRVTIVPSPGIGLAMVLLSPLVVRCRTRR